MSFLKDPVREPGPFRARHTTRKFEGPQQPGTNERREPRFARAGEPLDAEMLEVVETFEMLYAGLTPPPATRSNANAAGDFVVELPHDLPPPPSVYPAAAAATVRATPPESAGRRAAAAPPVSAVEPNADVSPDAASADTDWSVTSRTAWPRLLVAAGIALVLGTGVGYMAGKIPRSVPGAKIQPSPEGGARLRFDYDLRKR